MLLCGFPPYEGVMGANGRPDYPKTLAKIQQRCDGDGRFDYFPDPYWSSISKSAQVCVRARACVRVRACVCARACACLCTLAFIRTRMSARTRTLVNIKPYRTSYAPWSYSTQPSASLPMPA